MDTTDFNIRVYGGTDIIPPSTPTLLTIDPVASSQIDLTWSLSTDNFSVSGYVLSRGSSTIATTTQLNYSDTGLMASTTYSYSVRAFDVALNYSSSSNILSTTTLAIVAPTSTPTTTPVGSQSGGTSARVVMDGLVVDSGVSTTSFQIKTARPARIEIRWGRTTDYELGYIVGNTFKRDHSFLIEDLEPNTEYLYEIIGITPSLNETNLKKGKFTTLGDSFNLSPSNVGRFVAEANGTDIDLSWQNPEFDFDRIRVVRSHFGFPTNPNNGAVVYQGKGEDYRDEDVLSQYSPVYYTIFVIDRQGNISSGAVAVVYSGAGEDLPEPPIIVPEATSTQDKDRLTPETIMPELNDIFIIQSGNRHTFLDKDIRLDNSEEIVISLPTSFVSDNLKSIIVTILNPTDNRKSYSYLLKINNDRTTYIATIPALSVVGSSQIELEVYDFEAYVVGAYQAPFIFFDTTGDGLDGKDKSGLLDTINIILLAIALIAVLLSMLVYFLRKKSEDNNDGLR